MIALQYDRFGEPEAVIVPTEMPVPEPPARSVRLRFVRSPIHNHDLAIVRGLYGIQPPLPAIGGSELLGIVDALGDGVANLKIGQRVATTLPYGAWAEFVLAPANGCVPIPDSLSDESACQLLAMPLSALVLLDDLRVEPGAWIVQNAAGGAVGKLVARIGALREINVINLVRRESSVAQLQALGIEHAIATEDQAWLQRVREIVGDRPIERIVDSVCDDTALRLQRLLGKHGQYVIFGALGASALRLDPSAFIFNDIVVRGFWMTAWMSDASSQQRIAALSEVFKLALAGKLPLTVAGTYAFSQATKAVAAAEGSGRQGKVLFAAGLGRASL